MSRPPCPAEAGAIVPAIDTPSSTAAIRSLGRRGVRTIAVAADETAPAASSRYCDEFVTAPNPDVDLAAYEETLLDLAARRNVGTVLPFCEADVYVLARNAQELADHVATPWPSLDALRRAQDRVELFDAAAAAGVPTPETATFDDWDDWDREIIVKPRYTIEAPEYADRFSKAHPQWSSTRYVAPDDDLDREAVVADVGHVPLVQEYVPTTDEYGFFALYDRGEAVATFQHRQIRGWKYCGGPSAYRESIDDPELDAVGRSLLDELDWHGLAMVEFLRNPDTGEFELMEVNPRFWSSLPFTVQAGVDFPSLYWRQATGETVDTDPDYDPGVAGHFLRGEVLHLHSILTDDYPVVDRPSFVATALAVAASLARHPRFDYLDADDPGPFVRDLRNTFDRFRGERSPVASEGRPSELRAAVQTLFRR